MKKEVNLDNSRKDRKEREKSRCECSSEDFENSIEAKQLGKPAAADREKGDAWCHSNSGNTRS